MDIDIQVNDYISVSERLESFNILVPSGLAIIPNNIATAKSAGDLLQHAESDTVRTLLKANKIPHVELFDEDHQPPYLQQYGYEWFGPTIFVPVALLLQDPNIVSVTLGLITNYLYDLFKGDKDGKASLDVILQSADGSCKQIHYSGPSDGLSKVANIVKSLQG